MRGFNVGFFIVRISELLRRGVTVVWVGRGGRGRAKSRKDGKPPWGERERGRGAQVL